MLDPTPTVAPLNLAERPALAAVGQQALSSARYDQFLTAERKGAST
jgi:glutamate 5-kinase